MPDTSTAFNFCNIPVRLADPLGNLLLISSTGNKLDGELGNRLTEFFTFGGDGWPSVLQCGRNAKLKLVGVASTGINELRDLVEEWYFNAPYPRIFQFDAPDNSPNPGHYRYECNARLETWKFGGEAGKADPVMYEIDLKPHGPLRRMKLV